MALMITGAVVFAVGAFFGAVMVAVGERIRKNCPAQWGKLPAKLTAGKMSPAI